MGWDRDFDKDRDKNPYEIPGVSEVICNRKGNPGYDSSSYSSPKEKGGLLTKLVIVVILIVLVWYFFYTVIEKNDPLIDLQELTTSTSDSTLLTDYGKLRTSSGTQELVFEELDVREIEGLIFVKVNSLRGLHLEIDSELTELARVHSEDMVERDFFEHVNPDGEDATARAERLGIKTRVVTGSLVYYGVGENLAETPLGDVIGCGIVLTEKDVASCAVQGWVQSPGHYENLKTPNYTETGVGVIKNENTNKYLITQTFR